MLSIARASLALGALVIIALPAAGQVPGRRVASHSVQPAAAEPLDDATRADILAARDSIWWAWFRDDSTELARLLPAASAAGGSSGWQDRDAIVRDAHAFAASGAKLVDIHFANTRIERHGSVAVVFSDYTFETEHAGTRSKSGGRASEVFVKKNGVWTNPLWYLEP